MQIFTGRMPFLPPNQQRRSTEGISLPEQCDPGSPGKCLRKLSWMGRLSAESVARFLVYFTAASSGLHRRGGESTRGRLRRCSDAWPPGHRGAGVGSGRPDLRAEGRRPDRSDGVGSPVPQQRQLRLVFTSELLKIICYLWCVARPCLLSLRGCHRLCPAVMVMCQEGCCLCCHMVKNNNNSREY